MELSSQSIKRRSTQKQSPLENNRNGVCEETTSTNSENNALSEIDTIEIENENIPNQQLQNNEISDDNDDIDELQTENVSASSISI